MATVTTLRGRRSWRAAHLRRFRDSYQFLEAYLLLIFIDAALELVGLDRTCALMARRGRGADEPGGVDIDRLVRNVLLAYRWYRPKAACLHRALAIYFFLKRRNIQAELCLGVRAHPFGAHSWVEHRGEVLGDSASGKACFHVLKRIT